MGLFEVFSSNEDKRKKSHLKNLVMIAMADGQLDGSELDLLIEIAGNWGYTREDVVAIYKNPDGIKFTPPSSLRVKVEQLFELVKMIVINKEIDEKEVNLCKSLAIKLNLAPNIVDDIIELMLDSVKSGTNEKVIVNNIFAKLGL